MPIPLFNAPVDVTDSFTSRRRVGVLYHPRIDASHELGEALVDALGAAGAQAQLHSAWALDLAELVEELDWLAALGGDGTVLRVARESARFGVPTLGVNFGRLGFLAEVAPEEALALVPTVLTGNGWIEERLMLTCTAQSGTQSIGPLDAVNEVFVGRGQIARPVRLTLFIDGFETMEFAADGLIVATPTGSTAYSLSAGGPVVSPTMDAVLVTPVVPHPIPVRTLVLPRNATIGIRVAVDGEAMLSTDGYTHHALREGDCVEVVASPTPARFLRLNRPEHFYHTLVERLQRW